MSISLICLLIAFLLPYLSRIPAAIAMNKMEGGYKLDEPRQQQKLLEGYARRSMAAHENGFEALLCFTAALFIASQGEADAARLDMHAMAFIGARVVFVLAYLADKAALRSFCWFVGFVDCIWIALL